MTSLNVQYIQGWNSNHHNLPGKLHWLIRTFNTYINSSTPTQLIPTSNAYILAKSYLRIIMYTEYETFLFTINNSDKSPAKGMAEISSLYWEILLSFPMDMLTIYYSTQVNTVYKYLCINIHTHKLKFWNQCRLPNKNTDINHQCIQHIILTSHWVEIIHQ